jgi:hypothetical protein
MLAGLTTAAWLAGVLFAGTASAETPGPHINVNVPQANTPAAKNSQGDSGLGGLVGGLLGTVGNTVGTVTNTVTQTVNTVTNTVNAVTNVVGTTVSHVVTTVVEIPQHVLPNNGSSPGLDLSPLLPGKPVTDILKPAPTHTASGASVATTQTMTRSETPPVAVPAATEAVQATDHPRTQNATHLVRSTTGGNVTRQNSTTLEKAAPADRGPSPLPSPSAPAAPVAPAPSFSSGNDGGSGARGVLATLTPQTRLAPPPLLGRLERAHPVAERGRTPGLPVTTPD